MEFFLYNDNKVRIKVSYHITTMNDIFINPMDILSNAEQNKYNSFKVDSGKLNFLLGRYSAKSAYIKLNPSNQLKNIEVLNGVFDQPFFTHDSEFDLSISHSNGIGAAIVFDKAYPMGIDIEARNTAMDKSDVFHLITKLEEITNKEEALSPIDKSLRFIVAWCLKEALAKTLKTGFTIPTDLLCLEHCINISGNTIETSNKHFSMFQCKFKNFPQYKGIAKATDNYVIAITYPQQLTINSL